MNIYDNDGNLVSNAVKTTEANAETSTEANVSLEYILQQMEKIRADNSATQDAFKMLREIDIDADGSHAAADSIGKIAKAREQTNHKLLEMYEKMYEDIRSPRKDSTADTRAKMLDVALEMSKNSDEFNEYFVESFGEAFKQTFVQW